MPGAPTSDANVRGLPATISAPEIGQGVKRGRGQMAQVT
jgi:hypothetical protein